MSDLSKTTSRASSTGTRASIFGRASAFRMGSRRNAAATDSQASASSSTLNLNKTQSNAANAEKQTGPRKFTKVFPAPDSSVKLQKPAPLSDSQQAKYDEVLQHFKSTEEYPTALKAGSPKKPLTEWEKLRLLSRESMLRYLRASKWDVATAKKRLTETIAWRREYGVDSLKAEDLEEEAKTGKETVLGFDNKGRPLHYMHPSRNTTEETPRQMQYAVWILERAIDVMPPGVEMLALLINFGGKKRNPTSISNAKLMLYILQNHYVERLGIALCINVPWIFKAFWSAIQPFIDPVTKGKCKFDEAIKDEVPNAQLASDFGGLLDFPYEHDKYWPQLLELTKKRREEQLERFRTVCNSEIGASEWDMRGGEDFDRNPFAPQKQDSGFHELEKTSSADTAKKGEEAGVAAAGAAAGASHREGSSKTASTAVADKPSPVYEAAPGAEEDDDQLDRFYTSQQELPPSLEGKTPNGEDYGWENKTVVNDESQSQTHHSQDGAATPTKKTASAHAHKHGDASLFAAVVGGISAGLLGGHAATGASKEAHESADHESELHDKHNHINHNKALESRKSESLPRPAPALSVS